MVTHIPRSFSVTLDDPTEDGDISHATNPPGDYTRDNTGEEIEAGKRVTYDTLVRAYVEWDVSSIPDGATILDTLFKYHGKSRTTDSHVHEMLGARPSTSTNQQVYDEAGEGTVYVDPFPFPVEEPLQQVDLGSSADSDLQSQLSLDWFAVGIQDDAEYFYQSNYIYSSEYAEADPKPTLYVEYTPPNVTPEVLDSFAPASVDPNSAFDVKVEVRDNDYISDVDEIWLKIYASAKGEGDADSVRDHYTFTWVRGTGFSEVGPGTGEHINEGSCQAGNDANTTDNFKFNIVLGKTACPGNWDVWAKVVDSASEEDSEEFLAKFSVNEYSSLSIDDATLTFSGNPGETDKAASENPTVCTIDSNTDFKIQVKLSGDWSGSVYGGSIPMANTYADQDGSSPYTVTLTAGYQDLWPSVGWGEGVARDCYWFLDFPVPLRDDVYSTTMYLNVVKA